MKLRIRPSISLIAVDRSRFVLHWKDETSRL